jgi:Ca2+-binding RTX toxin-like protein
LGGNDTVYGAGGDDVIKGGSGSDTLSGNDALDGGTLVAGDKKVTDPTEKSIVGRP